MKSYPTKVLHISRRQQGIDVSPHLTGRNLDLEPKRGELGSWGSSHSHHGYGQRGWPPCRGWGEETTKGEGMDKKLEKLGAPIFSGKEKKRYLLVWQKDRGLEREPRSFTNIFKMPICTLGCCSSTSNYFGHRSSCSKSGLSCELPAVRVTELNEL